MSQLLHDNPYIAIEFTSSLCVFKDLHTKKTLLQAKCTHGLFYIPLKHNTSPPQAFIGIRTSADVWHARLGHPSNSTTLALLNSKNLPCISNKISHCNHCLMAKSHTLPFPLSFSTTKSPLEIVNSDVWSPSPITSYNDFRFYIIFVDDYYQFT